MSNSDFEDRLALIKAGGGQQAPSPSSDQRHKGSLLRRLVLGSVTVTAGAQLMKIINANYDSIRDHYGIPGALGLGLGSIALMVFGVVLTIRAVLGVRSAHTGQSSLPSATAGSTARMQSTSAGSGWSLRFGLVFLACLSCVAGIQMTRVANNDYLLIRDQYGGGAAAALGLGGIALIALGIAMVIRAMFPKRSTPTEEMPLSYTSSRTRPQVKTSAAARAFFSLLGLAMGAGACFFLYMGSVAAHLGDIGEVEKKAADAGALGSAVIAFLLMALALLIGFLGLFFRGPPLRRVPIFFLLGGMLLYTSFQTLRIHPLNWPTFMAEVTRQLNNQTVE